MHPAAPEMEFDALGRAIVDAQDILAEAGKLTNAVSLIALELGEYECGLSPLWPTQSRTK
jgi:hypothetical protein